MFKRPHFTLAAICVLMLQGCAQLVPVPPVVVRQPASLRQPCVELPEIEDGERSTVLSWIVIVQRLYAICASRQLRAAEAADALITEPAPKPK